MTGEGPFLWLSSAAPPSGFQQLPANGMCISVFLFVRQGKRLLLGKYADDAKWTELAGLDPERYRIHGAGWTIPASHLKFGEPPPIAARRIADQMLGLSGLPLREVGVESDQYTPKRFPHLGAHFDLWIFYEAEIAEDAAMTKPDWYRELSFCDPTKVPANAYARGHEDIVERYLTRAPNTPRSATRAPPG